MSVMVCMAWLFVAPGCLASEIRSVRLALFPFHVTVGPYEKELVSFGDHANRRLRQVIESLSREPSGQMRYTVEDMPEAVPFPPADAEARSRAAEKGAEVMVYGFLWTEDSSFRLKGVMWDQRTQRELVSTDLKVNNMHALPGVLDMFIAAVAKRLLGSPTLPFYRTEPGGGWGVTPAAKIPPVSPSSRGSGPWQSPELPSNLLGVAIADLDGDGKNESVFVEETTLTISRFEGGNLRPLTQFSQPPYRFITANTGDIDGDGKSELLVCLFGPTGIDSAVYRYDQHSLRLVARFPNMILACISDSQDHARAVLVGQKTDSLAMFSGEMEEFELRSMGIVPSGKRLLPPGTLLMSYATGELGKERRQLRVMLNQDHRLMVFDQENRLLCMVGDRLYGLNRTLRIPFAGGYRDIAWPGRIIISDTDGDGENKVLLIKQVEDDCVIQALVWDGEKLVEKWRTIRSRGIISDYIVSDFKNEGIRSMVMLLVKHNPFYALSGPKSVVFAYDLEP